MPIRLILKKKKGGGIKEDRRNILFSVLFTDKTDLFGLFLFFKLLDYIIRFSDLSVLNEGYLRKKDMLKGPTEFA